MRPHPKKEELAETMELWNCSRDEFHGPYYISLLMGRRLTVPLLLLFCLWKWVLSDVCLSIFPLPCYILDSTFIPSFYISLLASSSLMSPVVKTVSSPTLMFWQLCYPFQVSPENSHSYRSSAFSLPCSHNRAI